jgi:hypothetical protein
MKIVILRSTDSARTKAVCSSTQPFSNVGTSTHTANNHYNHDPFTVIANTTYADRVLAHLTVREGYCRSCGERCISCKKRYTTDFSDNIVGSIEFPATLPVIIDDPEEFVPENVPPHDLLLAISVNEEVLLSFLQRHPVSRAVVVPIEESYWVTPYGKGAIEAFCEGQGIEVAFPKPFCSFEPHEGVLKVFRDEFRIGKPKVEYIIESDSISSVKVICSAPCGATYFTARKLTGRKIDEDLAYIIDNALSSYPCTAGREVDRGFNDSITHQAVKIQRAILKQIDKYCIKK